MKKTIYLACFLAIICAIFGGAIAFVNELTAPIIAEQAMAAETAVFKELDPEAKFSELDITSDTSGLVKKGFYGESSSNKYWVYNVNVTGFNSGTPISFMVGFNAEGKIILFNVLSQQETEGIGTRISTKEFEVTGKNVNDAINPLSGATVSSSAVINGINSAKTLYASQAGVSVEVKEAEVAPVSLGTKVAISKEFPKFEAACEAKDNTAEGYLTFSCNAKGYGMIDPDDHASQMKVEYTKNEATIIVDPATKSVVSVELTHFGDTVGIGDKVNSEEYFKLFEGLNADSEADTISGATWTSESLIAMVQAALAASN